MNASAGTLDLEDPSVIDKILEELDLICNSDTRKIARSWALSQQMERDRAKAAKRRLRKERKPTFVAMSVSWGSGTETYDSEGVTVAVDKKSKILRRSWLGSFRPKAIASYGHGYQAREDYERDLQYGVISVPIRMVRPKFKVFSFLSRVSLLTTFLTFPIGYWRLCSRLPDYEAFLWISGISVFVMIYSLLRSAYE